MSDGGFASLESVRWKDMTPRQKLDRRNEMARARYADNPAKDAARYLKRKQEKPELLRQERLRSYYKNKSARNQNQKVYNARTKADRPWWVLVTTAKARAKKIGVPFDLDHEWASVRWTGQCELSGISFVQESQSSGCGFSRFLSPSIDRIVPEIGYVKSNCRFILCRLNSFRSNGTDQQLMFIAKALVAHQEIQR